MPSPRTPSAADALFDAFVGLVTYDQRPAPPGSYGIYGENFYKPVQDELLNLIAMMLSGSASLQIRNTTGAQLDAGTSVYISGYDSGTSRFLIAKADATDQTKKASYVLDANIANNSNGLAFPFRDVTGLNTSAAAAVGASVYLSDTTPGGFLCAWPASPAIGAEKHRIGVVTVKHASAGAIRFLPGARLIENFGSTTMRGSVVLAGRISPGALAANQNNYNPANLDKAAIVALSASIANVNITGLAAGQADEVKLVRNDGSSNTLTLKAEDAASTAANRFGMASDVVIAAMGFVLIQYNSVLSRWVVLSGGSGGGGGSTPTGTGFRHVTSGTEDAATKLIDTADINANQVTNAKLAQMAQSTIKGRAAGAGTGDPSDLTATQATAILDNMVGDSGAGGTKGLAPAPAAGDAAAGKFLKASGAWAVPTSTLDINGLTAKTQALGASDVVPVYDATDAANRKLPLANLLGLRNYIINGDFSVFRGDSGGSNSVTFNDNAGSYANGWRFLGESNGSTKFRRASYATNGAKYKLLLEVGTNNEKFGIWYTLPNDRVMELRGKTITLSVWLKAAASLGNIKMGVAESTGTVDQTGTDPISAWGADGTTPTLTGWTFLNTPANLSVTTSSVRYSLTVTVGASANNLAVFIWNDDKTTTAAEQLEIEDVQLERGSIPTPYARLPEFMVCAIMQARILQVFLPQDNEPPSSSYATLDTRNGHPVLDFDDAATEAAIFSFVLSQRFGVYRASNSFDIILIWAATSATSGNVVWQASAERLALNDQDIDSDGFGSATTKTDAAQSTSGKLSYTKFGSTGISSDLMAAGEVGRLKIERVGGNGSDTMSGDAELKAVMIVEPFDVEMALPAA